MCNQFTFHHQFRIDTGRSKFEQKTDRILSSLWIPWTKTTRILIRSTWKHRVMHNTCIKHGRDIRTQCIWVDINLALRKGLKFYQTRSNAIILHETLPAYCILKIVRIETGEVIFEKVYASTRPPPKISKKHDWKRELGSEDAQQPEGQVVQQFKKFPIKPTTQIMIERGNPLFEPTERGNPLLEPTQGSSQVEEKRPVLRRSKHVLFMKKLSNMIERGNPL